MTRTCPSQLLRAIVLPLTPSLLWRAWIWQTLDQFLCWLEVSRSLSRPKELHPPAWDVTFVLHSLTRAQYEPLRTLDERFLDQKMLFLLALASTKRIGELHALSHRISHSRDWGEISFTFVAGFVAKTQDPSSSAPQFEGFTVPALPNASTNRNGRLLSLVQAVRCYLDRTAAHRPRCERLAPEDDI